MNIQVGQIVSHYQLLEQIGQGGMGVVYKAEDTKLQRPVALKFVHPNLTRDDKAKRRFMQEARAASSLDHPNICTIYEIDETNQGQMFIAMAYYEGETLSQKIANVGANGRSPLPIDQAIEIAIQIAEGLARTHEAGIVHRDIKPANIVITDRGEVKILDFGLAKLAGHPQIVGGGSTLGTVAYVSPEQSAAEEIDERADIWALGVILYEMLTGQRPFQGEADQVILYGIVNEEPKPVMALRSEVPQELERIVTSALAKEPNQRYQTSNQILADLKKCRSGWKRAAAKSRLYYTVIGTILLLMIPTLLVLNIMAPNASESKSIAILPFTNLSEEGEQYFVDGLTEDILTQLSKIADLRVLARFTIDQYEVGEKTPGQIGEELGVTTLLAGSIRREGERLRLVCRLIDTKSEAQVWAETWDRDFKNVFAIQSEVVQQIARTLDLQLSPAEEKRIQLEPTASLSAYDYYLKGREYYYRWRKEDNDQAITMFRRALELDASYALAWAGLGDAYGQAGSRYRQGRAWFDSAIVASQKAIELNPNSAEAWKAWGRVLVSKGFRMRGLKAYRKAVELNANYWPAVGNLGGQLGELGHYDQGLYWWKKGLALNPSMTGINYFVAAMYLNLDDLEKAEEWFEKARALAPDFGRTYPELGYLYVFQRADEKVRALIDERMAPDPDDAVSLLWAAHMYRYLGDFSKAQGYFKEAMTINPLLETYWQASPTIGLGHILWMHGKRNQARAMLIQALKLREVELEAGNDFNALYYDLAAIHAILGDKQKAYTAMEKAVKLGMRRYRLLQLDPWFANLHGEERFQQMIQHVKAQVDSMRQRVIDMGW